MGFNKKLRFVAMGILILVFAFTFTACDSGYDTGTSAEYAADIEVNILQASNMSQEEVESLADELDITITGDYGSLVYENIEPGVIEATIEKIKGDVRVTVSHDKYGTSSRMIRFNDRNETIIFNIGYVENGDWDIEISNDSIRLMDLNIYQAFFKESNELKDFDRIAILDDNNNVMSIKELDKNIYGYSHYNSETEIRIAFLNEKKHPMAFGMLNLSEDKSTFEFQEDFGDIKGLNNIEQQSFDSTPYLAEYTLNPNVLGEEKEHLVPLNFQGDDDVKDIPSEYVVLNNIAIDLDYGFDNNEEFIDLYERLGNNVEIYVKANNEMIDVINDPDGNNPFEDEAVTDVEKRITTLYLEDGIFDRASALIEFTRQQISVGNETIYEYEIGVNEVNGLPHIERFTIRDMDGTSTNYQEIPGTLDGAVRQSDDNIDIYFLGNSSELPEGDGSESDPFKIERAQQLVDHLYRGTFEENNNYILVNDIDMSEIDDWSPVGTAQSPFVGNFDGNGFEIRNFDIDPEQRRTDVGFFGYIGESGSVEDLRMRNINVNGEIYVGSLAGRNNGNLDNITLVGDNSVNSSYRYAGGLVGENLDDGKIDNISILADVSADSMYAGGLAGANRGNVRNSDTEVTVNTDVAAGGFVGWNSRNGSLVDSFAIGDVSGIDDIGGFVGINNGNINDSYADVAVNGDGYNIGGLVGKNEISSDGSTRARIEDSYSLGDVSGFENVGGLVGLNKYGFIGEDTSTAPVDLSEHDFKVFAEGNVIAEENNAGGLVGQSREDSSIVVAKATGDVSAGEIRAGGITGRNDSLVEYVCYEGGSLNATDYVGLVIGQNYEFNIDMSIFCGRGDIIPEESNTIGGFIGNDSATEFEFVSSIEIRDEDNNNLLDSSNTGKIQEGKTYEFRSEVKNIGAEPGIQDIELNILEAFTFYDSEPLELEVGSKEFVIFDVTIPDSVDDLTTDAAIEFSTNGITTSASISILESPILQIQSGWTDQFVGLNTNDKVSEVEIEYKNVGNETATETSIEFNIIEDGSDNPITSSSIVILGELEPSNTTSSTISLGWTGLDAGEYTANTTVGAINSEPDTDSFVFEVVTAPSSDTEITTKSGIEIDVVTEIEQNDGLTGSAIKVDFSETPSVRDLSYEIEVPHEFVVLQSNGTGFEKNVTDSIDTDLTTGSAFSTETTTGSQIIKVTAEDDTVQYYDIKAQ